MKFRPLGLTLVRLTPVGYLSIVTWTPCNAPSDHKFPAVRAPRGLRKVKCSPEDAKCGHSLPVPIHNWWPLRIVHARQRVCDEWPGQGAAQSVGKRPVQPLALAFDPEFSARPH